MSQLVFHPSTKTSAALFANKPMHSLLISGQSGLGTLSLSRYIANGMGVKDFQIAVIGPDNKGLISIASIQDLYVQTRSHRSEPLLIIIDDAEHMSLEAQNALLKLLEEPPNMTYFVLTSHNPHKLLPTILSRVQELIMLPVSASLSAELLNRLGVKDSVKIAKLMFLGSGLPAELSRLSVDEEYFKQQSTLVTAARHFIQSNLYQRLIIINTYHKGRTEALELVMMVARLLKHGATSTKTIISLSDIADIYDDLSNNGNVRIQMLRLCYRLGVV